MKKARVIATGRVQGVGFRFTTKILADQSAVFGRVKNLADGTVEILLVAPSERFDAFIEKLKKGPSPTAKVTHLEVTPDPTLPDYDDFQVRYE